jgi:DNA-binding transcriptional MerR regulator
MADDVQPAEGQGDEGSGSPYDSYLQSVPEEAKEAAEKWFSDTSKGLDAKLQEAAELKKTWGPYQQVDALSQYPPEQLSELLAWHQQVTSSDEAFQAWLSQAAEEAGFTKAEAQELEDAEATGELSQEKIEQLIQERATQQLQPLEQRLSQFEERQQIDATETQIRDDLSALEAEHKVGFSDEQKAMILDLGINYEGDGSWVKHGFERFQQITSEGQRAFVAEKTGQPGAGLSAGAQEAFKPASTFEEANKQLRERLRQPS